MSKWRTKAERWNLEKWTNIDKKQNIFKVIKLIRNHIKSPISSINKEEQWAWNKIQTNKLNNEEEKKLSKKLKDNTYNTLQYLQKSTL